MGGVHTKAWMVWSPPKGMCDNYLWTISAICLSVSRSRVFIQASTEGSVRAFNFFFLWRAEVLLYGTNLFRHFGGLGLQANKDGPKREDVVRALTSFPPSYRGQCPTSPEFVLWYVGSFAFGQLFNMAGSPAP